LIGDINLFLTPAGEDEEGCIGEIELMIAPLSARRQGYGRATLLAFLMYIQNHLDEILTEYKSSIAQKQSLGEDEDKNHGTKDGDRDGEMDGKNDRKRDGEFDGKMKLLQLKVKIGGKNEGSIHLFRSVGFLKAGEGENYFGEVEMVFEGFLGKDRIEGFMDRWGTGAYEELEYWKD
jgi:hypothetical protein